MRNPNRIFKIGGEICAAWLQYCPDWRFMQLISNFTMWLGQDPFYLEDEEFEQKFHKFIEEYFV